MSRSLLGTGGRKFTKVDTCAGSRKQRHERGLTCLRTRRNSTSLADLPVEGTAEEWQVTKLEKPVGAGVQKGIFIVLGSMNFFPDVNAIQSRFLSREGT